MPREPTTMPQLKLQRTPERPPQASFVAPSFAALKDDPPIGWWSCIPLLRLHFRPKLIQKLCRLPQILDQLAAVEDRLRRIDRGIARDLRIDLRERLPVGARVVDAVDD